MNFKLERVTPRLLNEKEVSSMLGISTRTLQRWRRYRIILPFIRIGSLVRYNLTDIVNFLTENEVEVSMINARMEP